EVVVHEGGAEVRLSQHAFQADGGFSGRRPCLVERRDRVGELLEPRFRRRRMHVLHAGHQRLPPNNRSTALPEATCSISCSAGPTLTSTGPSTASSPSTSTICLAASRFAASVAVRIVSRIAVARPSASGCR